MALADSGIVDMGYHYGYSDPQDPLDDGSTGSTGEINHEHYWYKPEHVCFVATASYGTPLAGEVKTLSIFRDRHLLTNRAGRAFVKLYYHYGPQAADFIRDKELLRAVVRRGLKPIVWIAEKATQ